MRTRRAGRGASISAGVVAVALGLVVVTAPPVAADITAISPASRDVETGGSVSATVTVQASGLTCISARASDPRLQPSFSTGCDDEPRWTTTLFVQAPEDPGTYTVRVVDDQAGDAGGRTFTLRVHQPPPPPTAPPSTAAPTTASTAATTTTAPRASTTTTPTTTTSTTPTTTTSTTAGPLPSDAFPSIAALVERAVPTEGLFFPLLAEEFRNCLPLTVACRDPGSGLVLVPARMTELTWRPVDDATRLAARTDLPGIAPMSTAGVAPPSPRSGNYAVDLLDLTAAGAPLRTLVRGLDADGALSAVTVEQPLLHLVASGSVVDLGDETSVAGAPFGRPSLRKGATFTEAAPAIPMFAATDPTVVYAIRPDRGWGLDLDLVPLLGPSVPFLVRGVDGPPGLYVARPHGLRLPDAERIDAVGATSGHGDGSGPSAVVLLGGAVLFGAAVTATAALVRRRRTA
ncbi:MAG TPA: hypothetical protein VM143_03175 [Acidimicrobiales bacterium]|nr:hypothetical protein [Acidimicrobiales bacterium]